MNTCVRADKGVEYMEESRTAGRRKGGLAVRIFALTVILLLAVSAATYASVVHFLPEMYKNELEESLQVVSEELQKELERYTSLEEAETLLDLFAAGNQASVTLLDASGEIVYPYQALEELWDRDSLWLYGGENTAVMQEVPSVEIAGDAVTHEVTIHSEDVMEEQEFPVREGTAEALPEDSSGMGPAPELQASQNGAGEAEDFDKLVQDKQALTVFGAAMQREEEVSGEPFAFKSYQVQIGETAYTMLVEGTMQSVNEAMRILQEILPVIAGLIVILSLLCAVGASLYLSRPIQRLSRISQRLARFEFEETCPESRSDEIGMLGRSLNTLAANLSVSLANLAAANQELRQDMEREQLFFAAASHELKTPVTILKGQIGGMLEGIGAYRDRDRYLARAYEVTGMLEQMLQEMLAVSRMESGAWELRTESVDMAELARLQTAEIMELIEEKSMEVSAELPEHLMWEADRSMMVRVLRNLLVNAVRYSPEGAGLRLLMRKQENCLLFAVENTGVSIPEESLPHLFDAFYRVERSRNRSLGGSGLGLYLVRTILRQHHGVCGAENSRDGVRIWFRLGGGPDSVKKG